MRSPWGERGLPLFPLQAAEMEACELATRCSFDNGEFHEVQQLLAGIYVHSEILNTRYNDIIDSK